MISSSALLADLKRQLTALEADLRAQSEDPDVEWSGQLRAEHARATERKRTAFTWSQWRDGEVAQAAVAWILASTFIRFCEDNRLLDGHPDAGLGPSPVWIAGPADRTARAVEHQQAHYEQHPTDNSRDWLQRAFGALAALPAGRDLVDPNHNPVWRALISAPAADALLRFWRTRDDAGHLVHDFTDETLDTRFLGDLYQDLSDHAKKTYALLQTPVFVEEFILDRTLTPAIEEFGLEGLKLIDPTCGSGHFLLGAFSRLHTAWQAKAPNLSPRELTQKALDSLHGVDLNPFAVAIARFRLTVAALKSTGDKTLTAAPTYHYHLAVGDSLLGAQGVQEELNLLSDPDEEPFAYAAEDLANYHGILTNGRYHVVVGNPPYITVKDKALSDAYRKAYETCHRQYALSVPFMELFFRLAKREGPDGGAGHVGQITSNSFMKREFGTKLIENLLSGTDPSNPVDLTTVIDTSGAYIPGHGTPTVILVGRRRRPTGPTVKAALGVRGEPGQPADPAKGLVWTEITSNINADSHNGTYTTITNLPRESLSTHPWSLSGGGASELFTALESVGGDRLDAHLSMPIGFASFPGNDEPFFLGRAWFRRYEDAASLGKDLVVGDVVRDWDVRADEVALTPYDGALDLLDLDEGSSWGQHLWRFRRVLEATTGFGGITRKESGESWWSWYRWVPERYRTPLSITVAEVATHNHFVLDRGGKVFKQTAPVIKLPADATESDHLGLLAILNTSTACFWLKQVCYPKGGDPVGQDGARVSASGWDDRYAFNASNVARIPLPADLPTVHGRILDELAQQLAEASPRRTLARVTAQTAAPEGDGREAEGRRPVAGSAGIGAEPLGTTGLRPSAALTEAHETWDKTRARMIFEQEELDWHTYTLYGLLEEDLTYTGPHNTLNLGERPFELSLARKIESGEEESAWFTRHNSTPITQLPPTWPADYKAIVERRLEAIETNPNINLLERPEFKRRWATPSWESQQTEALRAAALDRLERPDLWRDTHGAVTLSVAQLADRTRDDETLTSILAILAGTSEFDRVRVLTALLKDEAVPFLAAYRFKESGMVKFREWQQVWDLQRREDAGERVTIPVPPKYKQSDFRSASFWKARGKLDVPKERFVAYPGVGREGDSSPVLGWAGWDHADQALALARAVGDVRALGGDRDAVVPLLAGLAELEPWLRQWYAEVDPARGGSPAQSITAMLDHELVTLGLTRPDLNEWRPPASARGRRPRARVEETE